MSAERAQKFIGALEEAYLHISRLPGSRSPRIATYLMCPTCALGRLVGIPTLSFTPTETIPSTSTESCILPEVYQHRCPATRKTDLMRVVSAFLPDETRAYRGDPWVPFFLVLLSAVATTRSVIHIARHDGGAKSIAGIDIEVEGGQNIVAIFAQWGLVQLLNAAIGWIVVTRYRGLIPLILLVSLLENIGRIMIGQSKPLKVAKPPPGAYGSLVIVPLLLVAFWHSLPRE